MQLAHSTNTVFKHEMHKTNVLLFGELLDKLLFSIQLT